MVNETFGHYRIVEKVGAGGMGVVYRARDERLERDVALKLLPPGAVADEERRKRFRKEAMALSRLNHPNIATIYDFDTERDVDFLAMEYISGATLGEKLASGPLPEADVLRLGRQAAEALEAAHEKGMIHRDLKPANIMVTATGLVKVLDFGLAKLFRPTETMETTLAGATGPQALVGTLPYMAPEQLEGRAVDQRTDIHALGAVLYEMATGRRVFPEESPSQIIQAVLLRKPELPASLGGGVSDGLKRIILRCLEKNPADRYASARELVADLTRAEAGDLPTCMNFAPGRVDRRRRWPRAAAVSIVAALVLAAAMFAVNTGGVRKLLAGPPRTATVQSLAVLPLESISQDPKQDYFAEGITDSLITELGQLSTIRVISHTSVRRYKKTEKTLSQIAKELNVDMVVEGSVLRSADKMRVTAKLLHPSDERQLWSKTYEGEVANFLALQSGIAEDITRQIGIRLREEARVQSTRRKAVNPLAMDAYLKGIYSDDSTYFDQAVKLDPDFALPYTKIASGYFYAGLFGAIAPREAFLKMKQAALKALERDGTLGEAHGYLALAWLHYDLNWAEAEKEFKRAFALNPSLAMIHHLYAHYLMAMNRMDESMAEVGIAEQLDPFSWDQSQCFGWHCLFSRGYDEAIDLAQQGVKTDPKNSWAHIILGWSYEQRSMLKDATAQFQQAVNQSKDDSLPLAGLAHAYAVSGRTRDAQDILNTLLAMAKRHYVPAYDIAVVYMGLGKKAQALEWLSKAYEERSGFLVYIKGDRRFDGLRSDPGYAALMQRIGLPVSGASN